MCCSAAVALFLVATCSSSGGLALAWGHFKIPIKPEINLVHNVTRHQLLYTLVSILHNLQPGVLRPELSAHFSIVSQCSILSLLLVESGY